MFLCSLPIFVYVFSLWKQSGRHMQTVLGMKCLFTFQMFQHMKIIKNVQPYRNVIFENGSLEKNIIMIQPFVSESFSSLFSIHLGKKQDIENVRLAA